MGQQLYPAQAKGGTFQHPLQLAQLAVLHQLGEVHSQPCRALGAVDGDLHQLPGAQRVGKALPVEFLLKKLSQCVQGVYPILPRL